MIIKNLIWMRQIVDKLAFKHHVIPEEVEQLFCNKPIFVFVEKGKRAGEHVYMALGQTDAGRYLIAIFIYKKTKEALILSGRDMARKERTYYAKRTG